MVLCLACLEEGEPDPAIGVKETFVPFGIGGGRGGAVGVGLWEGVEGGMGKLPEVGEATGGGGWRAARVARCSALVEARLVCRPVRKVARDLKGEERVVMNASESSTHWLTLGTVGVLLTSVVWCGRCLWTSWRR